MKAFESIDFGKSRLMNSICEDQAAAKRTFHHSLWRKSTASFSTGSLIQVQRWSFTLAPLASIPVIFNFRP